MSTEQLTLALDKFEPYAIAYLRENLEMVQIMGRTEEGHYLIRKGNLTIFAATVKEEDLLTGFEPNFDHSKVLRNPYFKLIHPEDDEKWMDEGSENYELTDLEEREIDGMIEFYEGEF